MHGCYRIAVNTRGTGSKVKQKKRERFKTFRNKEIFKKKLGGGRAVKSYFRHFFLTLVANRLNHWILPTQVHGSSERLRVEIQGKGRGQWGGEMQKREREEGRERDSGWRVKGDTRPVSLTKRGGTKPYVLQCIIGVVEQWPPPSAPACYSSI